MTDVFSQNEDLSGRGLDGISHFFLTNPGPGKSLPSRPDPLDPFAGAADNAEEKQFADTPAPLYTILSPDGLMPQGAVLACLLALSLSTADICVGLVETTVRLPYTFFLSGGYKNVDAVFWETDPLMSEFLNMVVRLRKTCHLVLLNIASSVFLKNAGLKTLTRRCLVPTTVHPEILLNTYGMIKNIAAEWKGERIELVVVKNQPTDKAAGAAIILEKMARRFLSCSIRFVGSIPDIADHAAAAGYLSPSLIQDAPETVRTAAREIACNLIKSDGFR